MLREITKNFNQCVFPWQDSKQPPLEPETEAVPRAPPSSFAAATVKKLTGVVSVSAGLYGEYWCKATVSTCEYIQGNQKVSVHMMITT
jgi:hypothetical protein